MNKKRLSIACVLVSAITFAQSISSSVPTDGLIAYYPFDGNANDESGNGHHGTVNGAVLSQDRSGTVNGAYYFDGDDKITINHHSDFNISNLTFSITYKAIIYPDAIPNGNSVFLSKREPSGWGSSFEFSPDIGDKAFGYSNSISGNFSGGAGEDNFNTWKTAFYVHDNDSIKIYLDGEIVHE